VSERTTDEATRDLYLLGSGWAPLDKAALSGLWTGPHGLMRQKEAVARQTSEHTMLVASWYELASPNEKSIVAGMVLSFVLNEILEMAADPEFRATALAWLTGAEAQKAIGDVGTALRPLVKAWLAEE
jgi:hypothetical protein